MRQAHRAHRPSIRKTVLLWQLLALLLLGTAAIFVTYAVAWRSFEEARDRELVQISDAVARHGIENDDANEEQPGDFVSQVWEDNGKLSYASHEPPLPLPARTGFQDFMYDGQHWHGLVSRYDRQTVLVARESGGPNMWLPQISLPLLAVLLALTVLLAIGLTMRMKHALQPLDTLRQQLGTRPSASLDPLILPDAPRELLPLVSALNEEFLRQGSLIESQRRFIADAAHELRTPITAISLNVQLARKAIDAGATDDLGTSLERIQSANARASSMVEQLLTLARLDAAIVPDIGPVALDRLAAEVIADLTVLADAAGVDLGLVHADPRVVSGDGIEWRILLDNLVGNAVRYTPRNGRIDVSVSADPAGPLVSIDDTGPGIPADELPRVFDRFHRVSGSTAPGSGLGLAIVHSIAQRQGLDVRLENRHTGGLRVTIRQRNTA